MNPSVPQKPKEVRSLLVIHQGAIGDFILALPALENLRKAFPRAGVTLLGYPRILELAEKRFFAEEILSVDQKGMAPFFVDDGNPDPAPLRFFSQFDLLLVFGKDAKGPLTRNLERVCPGRVFHVNSFPSRGERVHLSQHLLKEISRCGAAISETLPWVRLSDADRSWGRDFWKRKGLTEAERKGVVVLHPGSGSRKKVWPGERFLDLARVLQGQVDCRVLVVMGPAEPPEIRNLFERMGGGSRAAIYAEGLSLLQLGAVMDGCRLFVGNDSGITHLAAALGLPTVAIFGPTDPAVWSPRGEKVFVVRRQIPCSPCLQERFVLCDHGECLEGIQTRDVVEGIKRLEIANLRFQIEGKI
jgi:ADP-heptose:LPS heptosyltransferase